MLVVLKTVGAWLKKNWKWILLPVGIILLVIRFLKKPPTVVSPELTEAEEVARKAKEQAERNIRDARITKDETITGLKRKRITDVKALNDEQRKKVKELEDDPEALNAFLLEVGEDMRDDEKP